MNVTRSVTKYLMLASIFLMLGLSAPRAQQMNRDDGSFGELEYAGTARVDSVIDPLTLQLDNKEFVSLVGLDIPDFNPHAPGPLSTMALTILQDYTIGKEFRLYQTKDRNTGRTNRMNHKMYHLVREDDDGWVQGTLLALGVARVRTVKDNPELAEDMYAKEMEARSENLGLWGMEQYQIHQADTAAAAIDTYGIIQGKVLRAQRRPSRIYLNFGDNYRDDFTVQVLSSDIKAFRARDIDPLALEGKTIEVRGWVKDYNGPYIEIDHPARLRVLD